MFHQIQSSYKGDIKKMDKVNSLIEIIQLRSVHYYVSKSYLQKTHLMSIINGET